MQNEEIAFQQVFRGKIKNLLAVCDTPFSAKIVTHV